MLTPLWEDTLAAARVLRELALFAALALVFATALLVDLACHLWATCRVRVAARALFSTA